MSFASIDFILFFLIVLLGTVALQKAKSNTPKHVFLLIASYFFYGYWDWRFCFLLMFVTVTAYFTAIFVRKKFAFVAGVTVPLVVLGIFKYFNFFISSFAKIFAGGGTEY